MKKKAKGKGKGKPAAKPVDKNAMPGKLKKGGY